MIDGFFLVNKPYTQEEHSHVCCNMCGVDPQPEDEVADYEDLFALPKRAEKNTLLKLCMK